MTGTVLAEDRVRPFRLAHLSDVHLGPLPQVRRRELLSKRITGYINWQRGRGRRMGDDTLAQIVSHMKAHQPDHIAVTGDLVNLALDAEIEQATLWLETLGEKQDVSVVPGNHDTYVPGALEKVREAWGGWMAGDNAMEPEFPYLRVRGNVALIGVNTGHASLPFLATGSFNPAQARRLESLLEEIRESDLFRVVMLHHPPQRNATSRHKRLIGDGRFRAVIARAGAELVLHGHTHLPTRVEIDGPGGPVPVFGVSAASQTAGLPDSPDHAPPASWTLFEIDGKRATATRYGFQPGGREVVQLNPSAATI